MLRRFADALGVAEEDLLQNVSAISNSQRSQSSQAGTSLRPKIAKEMPLIKSIVEYANIEDWETVALLAGQLYKRLRHEEGEKKQEEKDLPGFSVG